MGEQLPGGHCRVQGICCKLTAPFSVRLQYLQNNGQEEGAGGPEAGGGGGGGNESGEPGGADDAMGLGGFGIPVLAASRHGIAINLAGLQRAFPRAHEVGADSLSALCEIMPDRHQMILSGCSALRPCAMRAWPVRGLCSAE